MTLARTCSPLLLALAGCASNASAGPFQFADSGAVDSSVEDTGTYEAAAPTCLGAATPCQQLSMTQCSTASGCSFGCLGDPCSQLPSCNSNMGCLNVEGSPSSCECPPATNCCVGPTDKATCEGFTGCSWLNECVGSAPACDGLSASACAMQPGCYLPGAGPEAGADGSSEAAGPRTDAGGDMDAAGGD